MAVKPSDGAALGSTPRPRLRAGRAAAADAHGSVDVLQRAVTSAATRSSACFGRIRRFRRVFTRCDKTDIAFTAIVALVVDLLR